MTDFVTQEDLHSITVQRGVVVLNKQFTITKDNQVIAQSVAQEVVYVGTPEVTIDSDNDLVFSGGFAKGSIIQIEADGHIFVSQVEYPTGHYMMPSIFKFGEQFLAYEIKTQPDPTRTAIHLFKMADDGSIVDVPVTRIAQQQLEENVLPAEAISMLEMALSR